MTPAKKRDLVEFIAVTIADLQAKAAELRREIEREDALYGDDSDAGPLTEIAHLIELHLSSPDGDDGLLDVLRMAHLLTLEKEPEKADAADQGGRS